MNKFTMSHGIEIEYKELKDELAPPQVIRIYQLSALLNGEYIGYYKVVMVDAAFVNDDTGKLEQLLEPYADSFYKQVQHNLLNIAVDNQAMQRQEFDKDKFPERM